jgi:hypothetical protein
MLRIIVAAAVALSFAAIAPADAASKRKRQKVRHMAPIAAVPAAPYGSRTPGPVWATSPYDCFTDEGYGRYWPCGAGRDQ